MKRKSVSLDRLLRSNRFVLAASVLIAVLIWLLVAINFSPEIEDVIEGVSVVIDEQNNNLISLGLENFSGDSFTVDVTVYGKRYIIASLSKDDIQVIARTSYVATAGTHSLQLESAMLSHQNDVKIRALSHENVQVYFDVPVSREIDLTSKVEVDKGAPIAPEGYLAHYERLSVSRITIAGPEKEINRVSQAVAVARLQHSVTETTTVPVSISFLNDFGTEIHNFISIQDNPAITVTIPVYKRVTMPVSVLLRNAPPAYVSNPLPMTFTPSQAEFGISEEKLDGLEKINIGTIDFTKIPAGSKRNFTFPVSELTDLTVLDSTKEFRVQVDSSAMQSRNISVLANNIIQQNLPDGLQAAVTKGIDSVTAVGPAASLAALEESDIYVDLDFGENPPEVKNALLTVPVRVYVKGLDDCWVYGSYRVDVQLTVQ